MTLLNDLSDSAKPFVAHLDDLRKTVIWAAGFLFVGFLIAIPMAPWVLAWLKIPYYNAGLDALVPLRVNQVGSGLAIALRVIVWSGLLISLPFVVLSIGSFVLPGLTAKEKRVVRNHASFSILLFIAGVWMGFRWTVPVALQVMLNIEAWIGEASAFWETPGYVSFVLRMLIAFGLAFQLPLLVLILGNLGILTSSQLREKRRHVIIGLMVLAMFLTPSDPVTMLLMGIPLVALFEICIWLIWAKERKSRT